VEEFGRAAHGQTAASDGSRAPVAPESFFVKAMKKEGPLLAGEVERATSWALSIHRQYEAQEAQLVAH